MKPGNYQENNRPGSRYALGIVAMIVLGAAIYYAFFKEAKSEEDAFDGPAYSVNTPVTTSTEVFTGKESIEDMQKLILKKDERIVDLVNQLNALKASTPKAASPSTSAKSGNDSAFLKERNALKQQLQESIAKIPELNDIISKLKKENEQLASRTSQSRSVIAGNNDESLRSARSKNEQLEKKVQSLDAELQFMKIDCNLSRADVNQIISNSRQRQVLLSEALQSLNALSRSDDPGIRGKAKEKFSKLEAIAKTVRD